MGRIFLALLVGHLIYLFPLAAVILGFFVPGEDTTMNRVWIAIYEVFALVVSIVLYINDPDKWKNGK